MRAGETGEISTPVMGTLYAALDLALREHTIDPAEHRAARDVLDDLAQATYTIRGDADD